MYEAAEIMGCNYYIHRMLLIATQGNAPLSRAFYVHVASASCCAQEHGEGDHTQCHPTSFSLKVLKNKKITFISSLFFLGHLNFLAESLHSIKLAEVSDANLMGNKRMKNY